MASDVVIRGVPGDVVGVGVFGDLAEPDAHFVVLFVRLRFAAAAVTPSKAISEVEEISDGYESL